MNLQYTNAQNQYHLKMEFILIATGFSYGVSYTLEYNSFY